MDIFNRKRVEELEREVDRLKEVNEDLKQNLERADRSFAKILETKSSTPDDCKPGEYCAGCQFAKPYRYEFGDSFVGYYSILKGVYCGKGESCSNFIQKEYSE